MTKMEMPIDLGRSMDDMVSAPMGADKGEKMYPMMHLTWEKPYHLPEGEFTMTVRARSNRKSHDVRSGKYEEDIEILKIENVEGGEKPDKKDRYENASEAIDNLRSKQTKKSEPASEDYEE